MSTLDRYRAEVAQAVRSATTIGPLGPNSLEIVNRCGSVSLTPHEASTIADAVLAVLAPLLDELERDNRSLRQQLAAAYI